MMNSYRKEAGNYLVEDIYCTEDSKLENVQNFIDKFNKKIESYSNNGSSSYLLGCVDLTEKLSRKIGYKKGIVDSGALKGSILSNGGYYNLACNCFQHAIDECGEGVKPEHDLCGNYNLNRAYSGQFISEPGMKFTNEKTKGIVEDDSLFSKAYRRSMDLLKIVRNSGEVIDDELLEIKQTLGSKKRFYYYVDGLLNIAEIYLEKCDFNNCYNILKQVESEKRELKITDCRLYRLFCLYYVSTGNIDMAETYKTYFLDSSKRCETLKERKDLNELSSNCFIS